MILSLLGARKVFVGSFRVHHGLTGVWCLAVGYTVGSRWLRRVGWALCLDDVLDHPWSPRS